MHMASTVPRPEREKGVADLEQAAEAMLGPRSKWPPSLRFSLDLCERASIATAIYWGEDFRLFYNQAWAPALGDRQLEAFGRPAAEVWGAAWPALRSAFRQALATRQGVTVVDQLLPVTRRGIERDAYWTYSLTPIVEDGRVVGLINQGSETTKAHLAERRMAFQVRVADRLRGLDDPEEVKRSATQLLGEFLGAARVGYAEVDQAQGLMLVRSDWTRDDSVESLAGRSGPVEEMGAEALAFLRTGEVLALPDIRALPIPGGNLNAAWEAVGVRALIIVPLVREGELKALLYVHDPKPRNWRRSEAAMARDVAERTWAAVERALAEQSLRESEDHFRHTVELNPQVTWTALPDGRLDRLAKRWEEWTGSSGLGDGWAEAIHPEDRELSLAAWGRSVASGEAYDVEHRVRMRDGSYRWARSRAFPRHDADGTICLWYGSTEDIHKRREAEERQRLLLHELNHRVKNTLASVQAIAFQTLKGDIPLVEARSRFEARLLALSRAHNLLTAQNWAGAALQDVVRDATDHLAQDWFEVAGEPVWLAPRAALAIALALHELGTNAVKYGALSSEKGKVAIRWEIEGDMLRIDWREKEGPPVSQPGDRGFGSRLIERNLSSDLGGAARLFFEPDGLHCIIEASTSAIETKERSLG